MLRGPPLLKTLIKERAERPHIYMKLETPYVKPRIHNLARQSSQSSRKVSRHEPETSPCMMGVSQKVS